MPPLAQQSSSPSNSALASLRADMPVVERCVYLQTGTKGPISTTVWRAICDAQWLAASEGPAAPAGKKPLVEASEATRAALAQLFNISPRQLCWSANTSTAMRTVMHALGPNADDTLITSDLEHLSTYSLCTGLRNACNLNVKIITAAGTDDQFLAALEDAFQKPVNNPQARRILILSHVSCLDGRRLPIKQAVELTRKAGGISLIDGAQAVGQLSVDLQWLDADFYIASSHKWLLGPAGVGYIHVHPNQIDSFNPCWLPDDDRADADAAKRGEAGSVNYADRIGLHAAIGQISAIGIDNIATHIASLSKRLREGLHVLPGAHILGPDDPSRTTGLIAFTLTNHDADALRQIVDELYEQHRIAIKFQVDMTALRISLAAFNTPQEVDTLLRALRGILTKSTDKLA